ncbi:transposase [Ruegeria arenilitoris]|uniref:transposase n=1 Tax=Ruegeria arenilitoris TaxID=1173585 RepID=UPI001480E16C
MKYSGTQIVSKLKQAETDVPVADLCSEHCITSASFYRWQASYRVMDTSLISSLDSG